jgi:hypothetical protein
VAALAATALTAGLTALATTSPALAAPLIDCVSSDNGDPALTSLAVSPATVDVTHHAKRVHVSADASDTGGPGPATGIARLELFVAGPHDSFRHLRLTRNSTTGAWTGAFTVPRHAASGTWRIRQVIVRDRAAQEAVYGPEDTHLTAVPGNHAVTVTSITDASPPKITALTFSRRTVDTTRHLATVHVTARAVDPQSGITGFFLAVLSPNEDAFAFARLQRTPATAHGYQGKLVLRRFIPEGRWGVYAEVLNGVDRPKDYGPPNLRRLGFPSTLTVHSGHDHNAPTLATFRRAPAAVDVRSTRQQVTVTLRARDPGAGVREVDASLSSRRVSADFALHRISGTRRDGVWRGQTTLPRCPSENGTWTASVALFDRSDNIADYGPRRLARHHWPSTLHVLALPDTTPPVARMAKGKVRAAGPAVIAFNEAVNGIDTASAPVSRLRGDGPNTRSGPPLPGTWACANHAGAATSCASGRVRTAAFHPDQPFGASRQFQVILNPEHNLAITDLAGNPCDRDYLSFATAAAAAPARHAAARSYDAPEGCMAPLDEGRHPARPSLQHPYQLTGAGPASQQVRLPAWLRTLTSR